MSDSTQQKTLTAQQQRIEEMGPIYVWISQNLNVLIKLFVFTAALFAFPILTFFLTLHSLFDGNGIKILVYCESNSYFYVNR
jgi:hypothetical protein